MDCTLFPFMSIFIVSILSNSYYICFVYSFFFNVNVTFDNKNCQIIKKKSLPITTKVQNKALFFRSLLVNRIV